MLPNKRGGGYRPDPDIRRTVALLFQAVDLAADVVKADPSGNLQEYSKVIETASPNPVLPRDSRCNRLGARSFCLDTAI